MFFYGCYKDNYFSLFLHPTSKTPPWKIRKNATGKFSRANTRGAQPLDAEQPDVLLPGDGRGTPGRTAPRCYGGHPRAPVLGRRGSRPARKRPHPAGTDGRTPVALRRGVRPLAPRKTAGDTAVPRYSQDGAPRRVGFSGFARNLQGEGKRKTKPCTPCIYPSPSNCWSECWA